MQFVQSVELNAKFLLSLLKANLFTAGIATGQKEDMKEDSTDSDY